MSLLLTKLDLSRAWARAAGASLLRSPGLLFHFSGYKLGRRGRATASLWHSTYGETHPISSSEANALSPSRSIFAENCLPPSNHSKGWFATFEFRSGATAHLHSGRAFHLHSPSKTRHCATGNPIPIQKKNGNPRRMNQNCSMENAQPSIESRLQRGGKGSTSGKRSLCGNGDFS